MAQGRRDDKGPGESTMRRLTFGQTMALAAVILLSTGAVAARKDNWTKNESNCSGVLAKPNKADPEKLEVCADAFNTDARFHLVTSSTKKNARKSLQHLYENGSDRGSTIGREGLYRFGLKLPVREFKGDESKKAVAKKRAKYRPDRASKANQNRARDKAKKGVAQLKRKRFGAAQTMLRASIGMDGRCEYCIYNLACAEARQNKKKDTFLHLQWLSDLATDDSIERLIKARTDSDFDKVRKTAEFKRITGYARIHVVNTLGDAGEKAVDNIEIMLKEMGHAKPDSDDKDKEQDFPQVLFKDHAKAQSLVIAQLLNHPRVRLDPQKRKSKYDIVIVWGAKVRRKGGNVSVESMGPKTVDGKMAQARSAQNKVLAKPDQAINKVNRIVDTPERTYKSVESMGKRVEGTFNKGKGVFEKVTSIPDKITSL